MNCCWLLPALLASSNASLTSGGGRIFWKITALTSRPVPYESRVCCSSFSVSLAVSAPWPERIVSIGLLPITWRTALSAACFSVSSGWLAENRYLRASARVYCTLKSITTIFSSLVSMRTSSDTDCTLVASTVMTSSIGDGHFRFRPLFMMRLNWPKRSTTPIWRASTILKLPNATQSTISASTAIRNPPECDEPPPPPPPLPLPPPKMRRSTSRPRRSRSLMSGDSCLPFHGSRLPGSFQAMKTFLIRVKRSHRASCEARIALRIQSVNVPTPGHTCGHVVFEQGAPRVLPESQRGRKADRIVPAIIGLAKVAAARSGSQGGRLLLRKLRPQPLALAAGQAKQRFDQRTRRVDFEFPAGLRLAFARNQSRSEQAR